MKPDKIRDLDNTELERQLRDMTDQLFHLRFQLRMGQQDGLKKYRGLRKDRARILTVLGERKAAEAAQAAEKKG
jgi:large subunit ribosomal protein L29